MQPFEKVDFFWLKFCSKIHTLVDYEKFSIGLPNVTTMDQIYDYHSTHPRTEEMVNEIQRDVVRTMPSHPLFSTASGLVGEENRKKLFRVLLGVSNAQSEVGYCQGMNFVAATLLINLEMNEVNSFWMFLSLIRHYHFRDLYSPAVPLLPLRMYHFSRLIRHHIPNLWHHLNANTFSVEVFANQWIMTMFAYYIEPEILKTIWSLFFLNGWKYFFKFATTILKMLEPQLLAMSVEEISGFMSKARRSGGGHADTPHPFSNQSRIREELLQTLTQFKITNSDLENFSRQFMNSKLMMVVNEVAPDIFQNRKILFSLNKVPIGAQIVEEETRVAGFTWLRIRRPGIDATEPPMFLHIELSNLTTPNRPREVLNYKARRVQLPLKSIQEIRVSVNYIANVFEMDISKIANDLENIEKELLGEFKQRNALLLQVARADEVLKEVAKRKYLASKNLKDAVSKSPVSGSPSGTTTPVPVVVEGIVSSDVTSLLSNVGDTEREYSEKKILRDNLNSLVDVLNRKIIEIENRKNAKIMEMTTAISASEEVQNDIISRSIHSAIDSFPTL